MKKTWVMFAVAGAAVAAALIIKVVQPQYDVAVVLQDSGIKSLKVNKLEFVDNGEFKVNQVVLKKPNGDTQPGATSGTAAMDMAQKELTEVFPWGSVKVRYETLRNRLALTITTTNSSETDTIQGLLFTPMILRFPEKVTEYDGSVPLLMHNIGDVAQVRVSYGSGSLAVVSEDIDKQLMVGFPWALDRPKNTVFPLSVHTDRVNNYPDSYPTITRPIPPKGTDVFHVSLRFGRMDASQNDLVADVYKKFAETFRFQVKWPDRRPIGAIFLATASQSWSTNPQGWFGDSHTDVTTPAGKAEFKQRLLTLADTAVTVMKSMNAQGAITWDIEGQQFAHAISYIGDPRVVGELAPEMDEIADEYFARIRNAGLRVGVAVRPQQLTLSADRKTATQTPASDPAQLLIDKIGYARKRWNATLIYVDSNANSTNSNPMDSAVLQKVLAAFPDILLIPEHSTTRYYAYSAPYKELRKGGLGTDDGIRAVYPDAFSVIYTSDGPLDLYQKRLTNSVKRGDVLMYRTWFPDPQNEKVKALMGH
jgi:hypothetical protein